MVFTSSEEVLETPVTDLLSWILDSCPYNPSRKIILDAQNSERALSWAQIKNIVLKSNAGFRELGLKKGDCVFFISRNNVYYYPLLYGAIAANGIYCGAATMWTVEEVVRGAKTANAKFLVVEKEFIKHAVAVTEALTLEKSSVIVLDDSSESLKYDCELGELPTWNSLLQHGECRWERINDLNTAKETTAMRFFTSGSSGFPKAVEVSHYGLVSRVNQWDNNFAEGSEAPEVRLLHYVGLQGVSGHGIITTAMKTGHTICLLKFSIPGFIEACNRLKPDVCMLDPSTAMKLVKALPDDSQDLKCFRDIRALGMAFPPEARKKLETLLHPDCLVSRPYGVTETGAITAVVASQRDLHDPDSVGFTWPGINIKLIEDDGTEILDHDSAGELCISGPTMFQGYYNDPEATAEALDVDGWYRTGDIGYISSKTKQWYLVGRKKEVFRVNYLQVPPAEVEAELVSHPDILDAVIVPTYQPGVVDPKIKAFVVLKSEGVLTEAQILSFMKGKLAEHKEITGGIEFIDKVPRNATGKIMRWKLISA